MATVTCEIWAKYWPQAAQQDLADAITDLLTRLGAAPSRVTLTQNDKPQSLTLTVEGVPAALRISHEQLVDRINQRLGLQMRY